MISKKEKEKREYEFQKALAGELAKFVLDIIKLLIAGIFVVGVMDMNIDQEPLFFYTGIFIVLLLILWYFLFKNSKKRKE